MVKHPRLSPLGVPVSLTVVESCKKGNKKTTLIKNGAGGGLRKQLTSVRSLSELEIGDEKYETQDAHA